MSNLDEVERQRRLSEQEWARRNAESRSRFEERLSAQLIREKKEQSR